MQDIISQQSAHIEELKSASLALQNELEKSVNSGAALPATNTRNMQSTTPDNNDLAELKELRDEIISLQKHLVASKDTIAHLQLQCRMGEDQVALQKLRDGRDEVRREHVLTSTTSTQTRRTHGIDNICQVLSQSYLHPSLFLETLVISI